MSDNQSRYTPGPWIVCTVDGDDSILSIEQDREALVDEEPSIVAEVDLSGDGIDEVAGAANARLIAAAPDLLEALTKLRDLRNQWRNDDRFSSLDYMDAIDSLPWEAAIAKAEGLNPSS